MIGQYFRIRASSRAKISTATGLSHKQFWEMRKHQYRRMGENPKSPVWTVNAKGDREKALPKSYIKKLLTLQRKHRPSKIEDKLSTGAKTLLNTWFQDFIYQRRNFFTSSTTSKGTRKEDDGIDLTRDYLQDPFFPKKNVWRVVGEYSEGELDVRYGRTWDIKVAYTHQQMDLFIQEAIRLYFEQVSEYNYLFRTNGGAISRVLSNMPEDMISSKAYSLVKSKFGPDFTEEELDKAIDSVTRNHTYDDVPLNLRVHTKIFDCNPNAKEETKQLVLMCREYLDKRFSQLSEDRQKSAMTYIKMRLKKAHYMDVKMTEQNAKEWRRDNWETVEETTEPAKLTVLQGAQKQVA